MQYELQCNCSTITTITAILKPHGNFQRFIGDFLHTKIISAKQTKRHF